MYRFILFLLGISLASVSTIASAKWREAQTDHFIIYSDESDKKLADLADRLEGIDGLLRLATGVSDDLEPVKVRIYSVRSTSEVGRALGLAGSGVAGFYDSNIFGPYAVTPQKIFGSSGGFDPELVLHHEYAHHFMLQYFPAVYPQWYVEGFAELIGSSRFLPDGRIGYGMPAKHRGDHLSFYWAPLQEVLTKPARDVHNFDLYGQGWALTHFLTFSEQRAPQLKRYLTALQEGKSAKEAAAAFGDLRALNQEAHRYLQAGSFSYRPVKIVKPQPVIKKIRDLSEGEAAVIPEMIAFRDEDLSAYRKQADRDKEVKLRKENLLRLREKYRRHPNDAAVLHLLSEAEYLAEDYKASEEVVDRLLAVQPGHVRGTARKGLLLLESAKSLQGPSRSAKAAEARRFILAANKADPNDVLPMVAYYQTFKVALEPVTANALEGLVSAVRTMPGDMKMRQMLVDEYVDRKEWATAIALLQPIANTPHESPRREAARKQMEALQAKLAQSS